MPRDRGGRDGLWIPAKHGKLSATSMDRKQQFLQIYSTLPLGVRKEIVSVLDDPIGPVSWEVAFIEVENNTETGNLILEKLLCG